MYNTQERLHNRLFYHLFMKFLSVTLICFPFPPPLPHFSMYHSQLWGKKDSRNKNVFNNSGPHLALPNFVFQVLPTGHSLQLYWCADSQIFLSVFLCLCSFVLESPCEMPLHIYFMLLTHLIRPNLVTILSVLSHLNLTWHLVIPLYVFNLSLIWLKNVSSD